MDQAILIKTWTVLTANCIGPFNGYGTDCNDVNTSIYPGAPELVDDGIDQDCDNGDTCYVDSDSDGFRNLDTSLTVNSSDLDCEDAGEGSSSEPATDCDDSESTTYPNAPELVDDGVDQDCDSGDTCYVDSDSDGFRNPDTSLTVGSRDLDCNHQGEGASSEPATDVMIPKQIPFRGLPNWILPHLHARFRSGWLRRLFCFRLIAPGQDRRRK